MIPAFDIRGGLPPGIHAATWDEIVDRYATNTRRKLMLNGLLAALRSLRDAGCKTAYLDGSFITVKADPGDFDACWDPRHVDPSLLDTELLDFRAGRAAQKLRYGGELFPASVAAKGDATTTFLEYFQHQRGNGEPKGIVAIELGLLP